MKPVFVINGFLESGKTEFIRFTLQQDYFRTKGVTLLLLCEEGENEYDADLLKRTNTVVEVIEKKEDFIGSKLIELEKKHKPERILVEYNGMWLVSKFEQMDLPMGWGIEQEITCADASTYQTYIGNNNLKSIFMDMVRNADMVVFNRCKEGDPLPSYRRGVRRCAL